MTYNYTQEVEKQNSHLQYIIQRLEEDIHRLESKIYINPRDVMSKSTSTEAIINMIKELADSDIDPYFILTTTQRVNKKQLKEIRKRLTQLKWRISREDE